MIRKLIKPLIFLLCFFPLGWLVFGFFTHQLSANPISDITNTTGSWTLRFLIITLAISPLRNLFGWNRLIGYRRMFGLFAFFYGILHMLTYVWLDQFFAWGDILKDIGKRPFITAGSFALICMIPLALTSTKKAIARIGGKKWQKLHRLVYVSALAGSIHFYWLVKADKRGPMIYGGIVGALLLFRLIPSRRAKAL